MNSGTIDALCRSTMMFLLDSAVRGTIVLLAIGGVACFMHNAAAFTRHKSWLVGIIATGLMPLLMLTPGWRILPVARPSIESAALPQAAARSDSIDSERAQPIAAAPVREFASAPPALMHQAAIKETAISRPMLPLLIDIAAALWATGGAVMGGRLLLSRITLARLARRASPASAELQSVMHAAASRISVARRVRLLQSVDASIMPMTWGLFRPTILLPASCDTWTASRRRMVILHELSHTKRLDYLWILLAELIAAAYWFNPLWRWALGHLRNEAEQSCDEVVLAAGEDRCLYAGELVAAVTDHARSCKPTTLALGMSRRSTLESRVKLILRAEQKPRRRSVWNALAAVALIAAPLSQIRLEAQTRPAPPVAADKPATTPTTRVGERDTRYGGTLSDTDGKPIKGAKLLIDWTVPNRLGALEKEAVTDERGVWTVSADSGWGLLSIRGDEPGYVRLLVQKPDHELLKSRKLALTMVRAVKITGYIRDEDGQPIVGALITPPLLWYSVNNNRVWDPGPIYSGPDGKFSVDGLSPADVQLYISAKAFAPALITPRRIDHPVIEMLSKGGNVPGIVLGLHKEPLADVKVTLTDWRYKGLHRFARQARTDANGRFVMTHVPLEGDLSLQASVPNLVSVRTRVTARDVPPYEVQIVQSAKAHVEVVDDLTGKAIPSFQYSVSEPREGSDAIRFADFMHTTIESADAKFDVEPRTRNYYSTQQPFRLRVTADGYMPEDSSEFRANAESYMTVRLKRARTISGKVVNADGSPAAGSEVAWVRPDRHAFMSIDGTLDLQYTDSPDSVGKTDAVGHFADLKVTSSSGNVVAIGPAGFAVVPADLFDATGKLTLKPWASLSGKFMHEGKPMVNERLLLQATEAADVIWCQLVTTAGIDGSFSFRRAPASAAKLTADYDGERHAAALDLKSGQAARQEFLQKD